MLRENDPAEVIGFVVIGINGERLLAKHEGFCGTPAMDQQVGQADQSGEIVWLFVKHSAQDWFGLRVMFDVNHLLRKLRLAVNRGPVKISGQLERTVDIARVRGTGIECLGLPDR